MTRTITGARRYDHRIGVYTVQLVREDTLPASLPRGARCHASEDAAAIFNAYLRGADREHFAVLLLNTRHQVIGINTVSVGGLASAPVHPREVFKPALIAGAAAVILGHNHPSGNTEPSRDDCLITEQLRAAGRVVGVEVLDHLIVTGTDDGYHSLRQMREGGF